MHILIFQHTHLDIYMPDWHTIASATQISSILSNQIINQMSFLCNLIHQIQVLTLLYFVLDFLILIPLRKEFNN